MAPPPPREAYEHLPLPCRELLGRVSDAVVDTSIHERFTQFVAATGYQKAKALTPLLQEQTHIGWTQYFERLAKTKSLQQWKAKALAVGVPTVAVLNCRVTAELGRLLFLKRSTTLNPGEACSADTRGREYWLTDTGRAWFSQ